MYGEELTKLEKLLEYPEVVAMRLSELEYELFNKIPALSYLVYATSSISKSESSEQMGTDILVQRFYEVN